MALVACVAFMLVGFDAIATLDLEVDRIALYEFLRVYQS